ncbi:MAG: class I SAM-dependent methyltransferase [Actinomycetes bacterium]
MSRLDELFARLYDPVMAGPERAGLGSLRQELLGGLTGRVLELGAGTGANLPHYGPMVSEVVATEPSPPMAARLRERVEAHGGATVRVLEAPAERLPVEDGSVDHVVSTLVLCTVDDLGATLAEVDRVLAPDGTLVLIEHVASPSAVGRTLQSAATPLWRVLARGCHLDRDTPAAVAAAGFDANRLGRIHLPGVDRVGPVVAGALPRAA